MLGRPGFIGALALSALLLSCGSRRSSPNVIVVVIDTLRADRLGSYGNPNGLTPFLDELSRRGTRFARAYAASSWTNPSVASLFTSRYPSQHHVAGFDSKIDDSEVTLAERLHDAGWETFGTTANFRLQPALGFTQGFDAWRLYLFGRKVTADYLHRRLLRWLDRPRRRLLRWVWPRPMFLYIHCLEPHAPYTPPARLRRGVAATASPAARQAANDKLTEVRFDALDDGEVSLLSALYDGEVAAVDGRLRRLFASLEARGLLQHAIVVVTADHGEEFRDHGLLGHGLQLYQEAIHVPLLVIGPGVTAGRVVEEPVSLVDVAPTLLALLGLDAEPRFEGRSLALPLAGQATPLPPDILAELPDPPGGADSLQHRRALIRQQTSFLVRRRPDPTGALLELYDLSTDPHEQHSNPPALLSQAPAFQAALTTQMEGLGQRGGVTAHGPVDDATRARLRALGYAD